MHQCLEGLANNPLHSPLICDLVAKQPLLWDKKVRERAKQDEVIEAWNQVCRDLIPHFDDMPLFERDGMRKYKFGDHLND